MAKRELSAYKKAKTQTATPGQRVVMVYEGVCKNLRKAAGVMSENMTPEQIEQAHNALQLAERLVLELKLALDKNVGGELVEKLEGLYDFWMDRMSEANIKKDPGLIQEILPMIEEIKDSWDQAAKEQLKATPSPIANTAKQP